MFKETEVINISPKDYIYIGRPSKWGNPFKLNLGEEDRLDSIKKYEEWIRKQPKLLKDLKELKGKRLGCFCAPKPCHGDVLVKLIKEFDV